MNTFKRGFREFTDKYGQRSIFFLVCAAVLLVVLGLYYYNFQPERIEVTNKPVQACDVLNKDNAKSLLGDKVIKSKSTPSTIDKNIATSKCSYSDMSLSDMQVAALAIRMGINDAGIKQVRKDFTAKEKASPVEAVDDIGDKAFFDKQNGQLNVLGDFGWYIVSLGSGDKPSSNSLEKEINMVKVLNKKADSREEA